MREAVESMARTVAEHLGEQGIRGRTVTLKIRLAPFRTFTRSRTLPEPTAEPEAVAAAALGLFEAFERDAPVRLLGVGMSNLEHPARNEPGPAPDRRRGRRDGARATRAHLDNTGESSGLWPSGAPGPDAHLARPDRRYLLRDVDRPGAAEVELVLQRLGQVELATADVGAAVDDLGLDAAVAVGDHSFVPHGSDLWATPTVSACSVPPQPSALP